MSSRREDSDSVEVTLSNSETLSTNNQPLEVKTEEADYVFTYIDDGSGNAPASYDMSQERYSQEHSAWMYHDSVSSQTARSWRDDAVPHRWQTDLTNVSGGSATYRIEVIAVKTGVE